MSYCLSPGCPNPHNSLQVSVCQACGAKLLLRDRYRVMQTLGQGGFGATFLAIDESLPGQPNCVIKQLRPSATAPHVLDMARELFKREAETLGRIGNHPQVPRLLDYFEANQEFYLVQEYVSGSTLQQIVKKDGPLTELGVKHFLSEILPVLEYIHKNRVIHRDIKPANIIRRAQDHKLVLIDFGAVKYQQQSQTSHSEQTAFTSYAIGTPGFAPPEQMAMRPVPASDIYALGVTCIYLLTGKSPKDLDYDPTTGELLWKKHVHISDHFAKVIENMLEVSVKRRYQKAEKILNELDLEPYLESLEKSMTKQGGTGRKPGGYREPDSSGGSPSSPAARAAMAIRSRQRFDSSGIQSGAGRGSGIDSRSPLSSSLKNRDNSAGRRREFTGEKSKIPVRLDADSLQTYYAKGVRDFAAHDLNSLSLPRANLAGANFHQANLNKINLQGAILSNTDFGRANLNRANLRDTNLVKAYMSNADLEAADLRGADLSSAYLLNANLRGANLCGANLTGAKLTEEQLAMARTNWMTIRPSGKRGMW
ncbi:pentapeptide repeat-containing protein [Leptothermofonsia sichuanensis E412]|uniref:serine/threonine-protein kinase n=1 Tax=Leptothermofonsia sichuanensis TaxID=2917832 RepID=UPI001CA670B5|nr:serine/threonine-protein kinase [Leptothermofonsia sichuanensis]QZZ21296.1 pentapeptide repeat-containing protein [Leptothermofonsia sichuanensis E412]